MFPEGFFASLLKKLFLVFFLLTFILGVFLLVFGIFAVREVNHFQERWQHEEKLLLFEHEGTLVLGVTGAFKEGTLPHILTESEKVLVIQALQEKNEALLLQKYFMVVVFTLKAFDSVTGDITYSEIKLTANQVKALLLEPSPSQTLTSMLPAKGTLPSDDEIRGLLFGLLFEEAGREDPLFFVNEYRKGNIKVYPETFLFTLAKKLSDNFYTKVKTTLQR